MESTVTSPATTNVSVNRSRRYRRMRLSAILGATILLTAGVAIFGRGTVAWWARQMALRRLHVGAVSTAEQWLAWSAWLDPSEGRTDLMRAACFRQRYEQGRWNEALQSAERQGAPAEEIEQERQLGMILAGRIGEGESELNTLLEAGVSPRDVSAAFVHGYLARQDLTRAKIVLDAWAADHPNDPHVAYMRGVYWQWVGDGAGDLTRRNRCLGRAETEYQNALAREPRHELARQALADLLEDQDRLEEALAEYAALEAHSPASDAAKLGIARLLRCLGCLEQARAELESLGPRLEAAADGAAEMGQIELESGNHEEAQRWLGMANLDRTEDSDTLRAAATTYAMEGKTVDAERIFARLDGQHTRSVRIDDLLARLATGPLDRQAAAELERLSSQSAGPPGTEPTGEARVPTSAADLYAQYCSGCHGADGAGNGRGARHLFPRARDLRAGRFRLASTLNGVASLEDVVSVLRRGMPGTSMRAYDELSDEQLVLLAREVLRMRREGSREQLVDAIKREGDQIDEDEVEEVVEFCTTPGDAVRVPSIGPGDSQAVARGKESYFKLGCQKCHGDDGTGVWDTPSYDDQGLPSPPRDLVRDPFKGGLEPEAIYLRIFVGMPGTPHPACWNVPEGQLVELVHFCRSLSREPKRVQTNHQRAVEAGRRPALWAFDR